MNEYSQGLKIRDEPMNLISNKVRKESIQLLKVIITQFSHAVEASKFISKKYVFVTCITELREKENKSTFMYFTGFYSGCENKFRLLKS